jgi:hypothetical protein
VEVGVPKLAIVGTNNVGVVTEVNGVVSVMFDPISLAGSPPEDKSTVCVEITVVDNTLPVSTDIKYSVTVTPATNMPGRFDGEDRDCTERMYKH